MGCDRSIWPVTKEAKAGSRRNVELKYWFKRTRNQMLEQESTVVTANKCCLLKILN